MNISTAAYNESVTSMTQVLHNADAKPPYKPYWLITFQFSTGTSIIICSDHPLPCIHTREA